MFSRFFKTSPVAVKKPINTITDSPKRASDAVLLLRQDNASSAIKVESSNPLAQKLLGYRVDEIFEHDLKEFVPGNIAELIYENTEFEDGGKTVDSVLSRITNFKVKTKNGSEIPLKIRVARTVSSSKTPRFQLVMNDSSLHESLAVHREKYRQFMDPNEIFYDATELLTKKSIIEDIDFISTYSERNHKESCYAIFKFINIGDLALEQGEAKAKKLLAELIEIIMSTKRAGDIVGMVENDAVILIFPETPKDNLKIPVSRIHAKFPHDLKSEIRIFYNSVKPGTLPEQQLNLCLRGMAGTF